jgi:hypothetical protein
MNSFEKKAWRRDVASKCLIAMYGYDVNWEDENQLAQDIMKNVDALDKALEEKEKTSEKRCKVCGKPVRFKTNYCSEECFYKQGPYNPLEPEM